MIPTAVVNYKIYVAVRRYRNQIRIKSRLSKYSRQGGIVYLKRVFVVNTSGVVVDIIFGTISVLTKQY